MWLRPAGSQQCGEMCLDSGCILRVEPAGFAGELNVESKRKRLEDFGPEQLKLQRLAEVGRNRRRRERAQNAALGTQKSKPGHQFCHTLIAVLPNHFYLLALS